MGPTFPLTTVHVRTVASSDPVASVPASGENATDVTASVWPSSVNRGLPVAASKMRAARSSHAVATRLPSGLNATAVTPEVWRCARCGVCWRGPVKKAVGEGEKAGWWQIHTSHNGISRLCRGSESRRRRTSFVPLERHRRRGLCHVPHRRRAVGGARGQGPAIGAERNRRNRAAAAAIQLRNHLPLAGVVARAPHNCTPAKASRRQQLPAGRKCDAAVAERAGRPERRGATSDRCVPHFHGPIE
eukprot:353391-Chlamydomonas_euryale.AAC.2